MFKLFARLAERLRGDRGEVVYLTQGQVEAELEAVARDLGVSVADALLKLDRGELEGTSAELKLRMLRYLRRPEEEIPLHAA